MTLEDYIASYIKYHLAYINIEIIKLGLATKDGYAERRVDYKFKTHNDSSVNTTWGTLTYWSFESTIRKIWGLNNEQIKCIWFNSWPEKQATIVIKKVKDALCQYLL